MLRERPGIRPTLLVWWQHCNEPEKMLDVLADFVESDLIVDHGGFMDIANAVVSARLPATKLVQSNLSRIMAKLDSRDSWQFYSLLWIASKYEGDEKLMETIERRSFDWSSHDHNGRLVAGLVSRFSNAAYSRKLWVMILASGNAEAKSVLEFHRSLLIGGEGFNAVRRFLSVSNPSFPNKISHSKFLMLLSVFKNRDLNEALKRDLRQKHEVALQDPFYLKYRV